MTTIGYNAISTKMMTLRLGMLSCACAGLSILVMLAGFIHWTSYVLPHPESYAHAGVASMLSRGITPFVAISLLLASAGLLLGIPGAARPGGSNRAAMIGAGINGLILVFGRFLWLGLAPVFYPVR